MRGRNAILIAIFVLPLLAGFALAEDEHETEAEMLAAVKELQDEGARWFNVAGNTDLDPSERNKARRAAYIALKKAYKILDGFLEKNPSRVEAYEDRMVKIHMMIYWIRKESPMNVLPRDPEEEPAPEPDKPKPPIKPPPPGPKPTPPRPKPPTHEPAPPKPVAGTPEPPAITAKEVFNRIERFEREHPADVAGALERYRAFLARFPDPDSPLFTKALERCSILSTRLKDAYRELRNEDPDTLDPRRLLSRSERKLVLGLTRALKSKNEAERRRAAMDLGLFGSGEASYHLMKCLKKEKVEDVIAACRDALVRIGGKRTTEVLAGEVRNRKTDAQLAAIEMLEQIAAKDNVQSKYAAIALAKYVHSSDGKAGKRSFETLKALGAERGGVDGLMAALREKRAPQDRRRILIVTLGEMGDPRAAMILGRFFQQKGNRVLKDAATEAVKQLGVDTVPYLIPYLTGNTRIWTGWVLRQVTGAQLKAYPKVWREWWERH